MSEPVSFHKRAVDDEAIGPFRQALRRANGAGLALYHVSPDGWAVGTREPRDPAPLEIVTAAAEHRVVNCPPARYTVTSLTPDHSRALVVRDQKQIAEVDLATGAVTELGTRFLEGVKEYRVFALYLPDSRVAICDSRAIELCELRGGQLGAPLATQPHPEGLCPFNFRVLPSGRTALALGNGLVAYALRGGAPEPIYEESFDEPRELAIIGEHVYLSSELGSVPRKWWELLELGN